MIHILFKTTGSSIVYSEGTAPDSYITVVEAGFGRQAPGHSYRESRNCYVLHYVVSGSGFCGDQALTAPCGFLLTPDEDHMFSVGTSQEAGAWEHYWILFRGTGAKALLEGSGFIPVRGVFPVPYMDQVLAIFRDLHNKDSYTDKQDTLYMISKLMELLSLHASTSTAIKAPEKRIPQQYISKAIAYIETSYRHSLREKDIADAVHISPKYLYKLFRRELGKSPTQYLSDYRMYRAKSLLKTTALSIKEISDSVGFQNPDYFCHVFQKHTEGVSPTQYRKQIRRDSETKPEG